MKKKRKKIGSYECFCSGEWVGCYNTKCPNFGGNTLGVVQTYEGTNN